MSDELPKLTRKDLEEMLEATRSDIVDCSAELEELQQQEEWINSELDRLPRMLRDGPRRRSIPVEEVRDYLRRRGEEGATVQEVMDRFDIGQVQAKKHLDSLHAGGTATKIISDVGPSRYQLDPATDHGGKRTKQKSVGPKIANAGVPHTGRAAPMAMRRRGIVGPEFKKKMKGRRK